MSLRYLFGIPANINEVVARAQRTGEIPEVYATRQNIGTLVPDAQRFRYKVGVRIGKATVPISQWEQSFNRFVQGIDDDRPDFTASGHITHIRAEDLATELSQRGIPVLYNGEIYCSPINSEPDDSVKFLSNSEGRC